MNFLSHYYYDSKEDNAYFNFGLNFPDLVRNFVRGTKLQLNVYTEEMPFESHQIVDGCIKHISSDKIFHSWTGFHEMMELVSSEIRGQEIEIRRDWFISHILVELVLDHYLLLENDGLANSLYNDYESVDIHFVAAFLKLQEFDKFDALEKGLNDFLKAGYLRKYTSKSNIVFALERICTKMLIPPFTDQQKEVIHSCIEKLLDVMPKYKETLYNELHA